MSLYVGRIISLILSWLIQIGLKGDCRKYFYGTWKSVVDQSVTRKIAEEIPAEALVLVIVHDMYEQMAGNDMA